MKKLRMKRWVKITLVILVLIIMGRCASEYNRKQIISCVEGGNTLKFCEYHLGK